MSANRWSQCPTCIKGHHEVVAEKLAATRDSYGKIGAADYEALVKEHEAAARKTLPESLREDWELGVEEDGRFYIGYTASCQDCGYRFNFQHEQNTYAPASVQLVQLAQPNGELPE